MTSQQKEKKKKKRKRERNGNFPPCSLFPLPDRTFRKFGASKSVDQRTLCSSEKSIDAFFEALKL